MWELVSGCIVTLRISCVSVACEAGVVLMACVLFHCIMYVFVWETKMVQTLLVGKVRCQPIRIDFFLFSVQFTSAVCFVQYASAVCLCSLSCADCFLFLSLYHSHI